MAGAARETRPEAVIDTATATLIADAGLLGSASLTALNGSRWSPAAQQAEVPAQFDRPEVDTTTLVMGVGVFAFLLLRPLGRALRRQAQQRRAVALASTLHHAPRG